MSSGKRYFRAIGQQIGSTGVRAGLRYPHYRTLPAWAREQIVAGYVSQMPMPPKRVHL